MAEKANTTDLAVKVNRDELKRFNLSDYTPSYVTDLALSTTAASQCTTYLENYMYTCQETSTSPTGFSSYVLNRTDLAGNFLDSMFIKNGGHGSAIGLEASGDDIYVWSFLWGSKGSYKLARFPYVSGATIDDTEATTVYYDPFTTDYLYPFINHEQDKMIIKRSPSGSPGVVEVRNLSDVKNGVDNILHSHTLKQRKRTQLCRRLACLMVDIYIYC